MTAGDAVAGAPTSVPAGGFLNLTPGSGIEWVIHNISAPTTATIEVHYGGSAASVCTLVTTGGLMGFFLHCTDTVYYKIKNTGVGAVDIGYDGIVTK